MQAVIEKTPENDVVRSFFGMIAQGKQAAVCLLGEVLKVGVSTGLKGSDIVVFSCILY